MICLRLWWLLPLITLSVDLVQAAELGPKMGEEAPPAVQAPSTPSIKPVLDQIVVVVNQDVITQSELNTRTDLYMRQLQKQSGKTPDREMLKRQVLERMISDKVLDQYARETGLRVDDSMLDRAIAAIAEENKLPLKDFRSKIEKDGLPWAGFREEIRQEIIVGRLRDREVDSKIVVTDAEVDALIKEENARGGSEDELLLSHILVSVPEQADPERIAKRESRAKEALQRLRQGEPFAQVAASFSDAQDALQGGSLGWRPMSRVPSLFASVAVQMKVGEVSNIIRSGNGFHIFAVMDRRGKAVAERVTQYHLREILMRLDSGLPESEVRARLLGVRARVTAGEDFLNLAHLVSEDENRAKGGDIGWVAKGESFPEFERVMLALKPGQVSDVIKTQLGLHLLQLVETREADLGEERRRIAAKQGIRARKVDEAFESWLRELRDTAFVDYRQKQG